MTDQPAAEPTPDLAAIEARRKPFDGQLSVANIDRLIVIIKATAAERDRLKGDLFEQGKDIARFRTRNLELVKALKGLLDACESHDKANQRQMVDPHAERAARAALVEDRQS